MVRHERKSLYHRSEICRAGNKRPPSGIYIYKKSQQKKKRQTHTHRRKRENEGDEEGSKPNAQDLG